MPPCEKIQVRAVALAHGLVDEVEQRFAEEARLFRQVLHRGEGAEQLPLVAFKLVDVEDRGYDEFDVAAQLAAERGWMLPAYTLPPNAEHVTIMRALVKRSLGRSLAETLANDIAEACETLSVKGGLHELDRRRVKTGVGY